MREFTRPRCGDSDWAALSVLRVSVVNADHPLFHHGGSENHGGLLLKRAEQYPLHKLSQGILVK